MARAAARGWRAPKSMLPDEQRLKPAAHKWLKGLFPRGDPARSSRRRPLTRRTRFPSWQNEGMGLLFTLTRDGGQGTADRDGAGSPAPCRVLCAVPDEVTGAERAGGAGRSYISIASLIQRYAAALFPGFTNSG